MARPARYGLERVPGSPEIEALQDRLAPLLERLSSDADAAGDASTAAASYTPARASDWAGDPPTTLAEAQDRIAYHLSSGAGAVPIVELP